MKIKIQLQLSQILYLIPILLLLCSGILLVLRKLELAERFALYCLISLVIDLLYNPIASFFRTACIIFEKIRNLSFNKILIIIAGFYLFSSFIQFGQDEGWYLTRPKVYGADEEHLLLMMNSLINDYDLELSNNYENAKKGDYDAGEAWRFKNLDHHSIFVNKRTKEKHHGFYVIDVGGDFSKYNIADKEVWNNRAEYYERPHHPPGMPLTFALLLWPFRGLIYIESIALLMNTAIALISLVLLHKILIFLGIDSKNANLSIFLIALATPVYHYSLILMKEGFLGVIFIVSCWLFFIKRNGFWAGLCIILGSAVRYPFPVITIPMIIYCILIRDRRLLLSFIIGLLLGSLFYGLYNYNFYAALINIGRSHDTGVINTKSIIKVFVAVPLVIILIVFLLLKLKIKNIIVGKGNFVNRVFFWGVITVFIILFLANESIRKTLINFNGGVLITSPFLMFAIFEFADFRMWQKKEVAGILAAMFSYVIIYLHFRGYETLSVYAARKFVPIMPLMAIPFAFWLSKNRNKAVNPVRDSRCQSLTDLCNSSVPVYRQSDISMAVSNGVNNIFCLLAGYSLILNFIASLAKRYFWHLPVDQAIIQLVKRWLWV